MHRTILIALCLIIIGAIPSLTFAETPPSETVVPMNSLPSYGSLVSAWYKQPVYDSSEKRVGTVADMLFTADGSINAVILDVGGFLGVGKKHVAVALDAISLTKRKNKTWLTINTTKDAVKNASGYSYDKKDGVWNPR